MVLCGEIIVLGVRDDPDHLSKHSSQFAKRELFAKTMEPTTPLIAIWSEGLAFLIWSFSRSLFLLEYLTFPPL